MIVASVTTLVRDNHDRRGAWSALGCMVVYVLRPRFMFRLAQVIALP